jgi:predicted TIM-barrel fold metal-dependent hydrolase
MIDAHVFVGESLYENSLEPRALLQTMEHLGVDAAVIRALKPPDFDMDAANRRIGEIQKQEPRLAGFARVNPLERLAPEQAKRAVEEYGLKGLHLHPWEENCPINAPKVDKVIKALGGKVPVYISAGFPVVSHPLQVQELAERHPDTLFVAAHGGQQDNSGMSFDDSLLVARETANVLFDVAGVYRRDFIELLVETAGPDRILFGSGTPYMDMALEITRIQAVHLSEETKGKIFHENLARLLGLEDLMEKSRRAPR